LIKEKSGKLFGDSIGFAYLQVNLLKIITNKVKKNTNVQTILIKYKDNKKLLNNASLAFEIFYHQLTK